jgi:PBP1b-binding outer membrane lipoprotein LpoB
MKPLVLVLAALILVAAGCAKPAPPTSVMDTPEYHYKNGLKYLDR